MNVLSFIHPVRTFLPCSGVGRHMNGVLTCLAARPDTSLQLLFSEQWLAADGRLPANCPLRDLPATTFTAQENRTERLWKLCGRPRMDRFIPAGTDWVYCPMDTRFPTTRCPVAVTIHDIQAFETGLPWSRTWGHRRFRFQWGLWLHKAIRDSRLVFTVSEFSRRRMIELLGAPGDKIVVAGNGIGEVFLEHARTAPHRPTTAAPRIAIVGGLREKKGAAWTLAVARELKPRLPDARFLVIGPSEPRWQAEAESLGTFEFTGWLDDDQLPALLADAVALLFLSPYEGFGIPAIEAMAMGTPPVVADRASLPGVVGSHGFVVDPEAAPGIADLLAGLVTGAVRYDAASGQRWAATFTWSAVADRVHQALACGGK
jgi:glycosyltransferase involved in cell wall biosynthesis